MRELLVLLVIIAVIAIVWYLRQQSAQDAERRKVDEFRRLQAAANEAERREREALAARTGTAATGARADDMGPVARGGGLFQEAADAASGREYERAADELDEMSAELARARQEADRAAARLAGRAGEAMAAVQAAAAAHGGAVPGDGTRDCPSQYPVKGHMTSMRYYEPGRAAYDQTIPEVCFQSAVAAEAAGFTSFADESGSGGAVIVEDVVARETVVAEAVAAADAGGVPPGAIRGDGSRDCPSAYPIKGNESSLLYHEPGTATYERTVPELCFSSVDSAVAAGFTAAHR